MREVTSHRIVNFIGGLLPLYVREEVDGVWCARSLTDGNLLIPLAAEEGNDDEWVTVHWQGDPNRSSVVHGTFLATAALARYIEVHSISSRKETKDEYAILADHFTRKTNASLVLEIPDPEVALANMIAKAVKVLGREALTALIKAKLGI